MTSPARPTSAPPPRFLYRQSSDDITSALSISTLARSVQRTIQETRQEWIDKEFIQEWNDTILPQWDITSKSDAWKEMCLDGVPFSIRSDVWIMGIGNHLSIDYEQYQTLEDAANILRLTFSEAQKQDGSDSEHSESNRSEQSSMVSSNSPLAKSLKTIDQDLPRTITAHDADKFGSEDEFFHTLRRLLEMYCCLKPSLGYVQGMNFVATIFLAVMENEKDAFVAFANFMERPLFKSFFKLSQSKMQAYIEVYDEFLFENLPELHGHLMDLGIDHRFYLYNYILSLFVKQFPISITIRVIDNIIVSGDSFVFRTVLGLLKHYEKILLSYSFEQIMKLLTCCELSEDTTVQAAGKRQSSTIRKAHVSSNGSYVGFRGLREKALFDSIKQIRIPEEDFVSRVRTKLKTRRRTSC